MKDITIYSNVVYILYSFSSFRKKQYDIVSLFGGYYFSGILFWGPGRLGSYPNGNRNVWLIVWFKNISPASIPYCWWPLKPYKSTLKRNLTTIFFVSFGCFGCDLVNQTFICKMMAKFQRLCILDEHLYFVSIWEAAPLKAFCCVSYSYFDSKINNTLLCLSLR